MVFRPTIPPCVEVPSPMKPAESSFSANWYAMSPAISSAIDTNASSPSSLLKVVVMDIFFAVN